MNRPWKTVIVIAIAAVALLSCAPQEAEEPQMDAAPAATPAPAAVETGPDPTEVDADHYKTEFENDRVRVLRITYGPGEQSIMHHHPDSVAVFLTDHHVKFTAPDGASQDVQIGAGQHVFSPAEQHLPENIGDTPLELILVELKPGPGPGPGAAHTGPDATVADSDHYTAEFENDRVRVLRITYGPGEQSVMHYHPDSVAVFLTDHHVKFSTPDGASEEVQTEAGQHVFSHGEQHLPENIGDQPLELVLVELK
jgi:quercetin dioxygenase-like cupin family protein